MPPTRSCAILLLHVMHHFPPQEQSREDAVELKEEDVIPNTPSLITYSSRGYIKRMPVSTWDVQRRGGKGGRAAAAERVAFSVAACLGMWCALHSNLAYTTQHSGSVQVLWEESNIHILFVGCQFCSVPGKTTLFQLVASVPCSTHYQPFVCPALCVLLCAMLCRQGVWQAA